MGPRRLFGVALTCFCVPNAAVFEGGACSGSALIRVNTFLKTH